MNFQLRVHCAPQVDLHHASKLLTAVCGLARRGVVRYVLDSRNPWQLDDLALGIEVINQDHSTKLVFDMRDRSTVFCLPALQVCDVYFKRGFVRAHLDSLPPNCQRKVRPYGLNFTCRGYGSTLAVLRAQFPTLFLAGLRLLRGDKASLKERLAAFRKYFGIPSPDTFFQRPDTSVSPAVLFQTRVWEPAQVYPDDPEAVNATRAQLVRVLRKRFGKQFWGGVVPTEFARKYCPDALTTLPTHRKDYAVLCKKASIGVYSRGLHFSNAYKLSEYLAASHAIVSDVLVQELPTPLVEGKHLLQYRHVEECADRCAELLANPDLVQAMRRANHEYYCREVEPLTHLLKCLTQSMTVVQPRRPHFSTDSIRAKAMSEDFSLKSVK